MRVEEALSFQEYWDDPRFRSKRPSLNGSQKQWYGDNIYSMDKLRWSQADSHHSKPGGEINDSNLRSDTSVDRVLISSKFAYWGDSAPNVPAAFRNWEGVDIVHHGVGHRCHFPQELVNAFAAWIEPELRLGRKGRPRDWGS
jgi:hypothetical protein